MLAIKLKEKGFNEQCLGYYDYNNKLHITNGYYEHPMDKEQLICKNSNLDKMLCSAPIFQQVIDWFKYKHNVHISINADSVKYVSIAIHRIKFYRDADLTNLKDEDWFKERELNSIGTCSTIFEMDEVFNKAIEESLKFI